MAQLGYREKCLAQKINACNVCGHGEDLLVHHINGDDTDDRLENLVPLCRSCHAKVHMATDPGGAIGEFQQALPESSIRDTGRIRPDEVAFVGAKVAERRREALKEVAEREDRTVSDILREAIDDILDGFDIAELLEPRDYELTAEQRQELEA